jgi:hypothetical protein
MPRSNSQLRGDLSATQAPTRLVASGGQTQQITVNLGFQGVGYRPLDVIDALEAKYGAGKVTTPRDAQSPYGTLDLTITP